MIKVRTTYLQSLLWLVGTAWTAQAQPFNPPRWTDDHLQAKANWPASLPALKGLHLPGWTTPTLNLGGEARTEYIRFENENWGAAEEDSDGYLLWRWQAFADWTGPGWRIFGQIKGTGAEDQEIAPSPVDINQVDLHELFAEWSGWNLLGGQLTSRIGRQELAYGSHRLVTYREGPSNRLAFDALRLIWKRDGLSVDLFAAGPVEVDRGPFDDARIDGSSVSGLYATARLLPRGLASIDLYGLFSTQSNVRYAAGRGDEERTSLGARLFGRNRVWDYDIETVLQFGRWGGRDIWAWTVASDGGYTWASAPGRPRLGLKAAVASGDDDPQDDELNTFNALYPRGSYFGPSSTIGPANFANLHPTLALQLNPQVTAQADVIFFWRQSSGDGLYSPSRRLIRSPGVSPARTVGTQVNFQLAWKPDPRLLLTFEYEIFQAGTFIEQSGPSEDLHYFSSKFHLRF